MITKRPTENYRIIEARAKKFKQLTTQDLTYFRFLKKKKRRIVFPLLTLCNSSNLNDRVLQKQLCLRVMNSHGIGLCVYTFSGTILDADSDSATNVKCSALQGND